LNGERNNAKKPPPSHTLQSHFSAFSPTLPAITTSLPEGKKKEIGEDPLKSQNGGTGKAAVKKSNSHF
jgi:hypothetical protein